MQLTRLIGSGKYLLVLLAIVSFCFSAVGQRGTIRPSHLARIALVSDTHTTRGTNDEQTLYRGRLDKVIAAVNTARVDVVLIAGDLTQDGKPEEIADFQGQIRGFHAPVWFVPGNHDIGNKLVRGKESETTLSEFRLAQFEMRCGPSFFVREDADIRVIGLNSPIFGSDFGREKAMWRFLEHELAQPSTMPTVVFMHYPLFTKTPNEPGDYWNIEPEPRQRLLELLRRGGVKTVLTGHLHRSLSTRSDGIVFLTTGPVSFGLPHGKQKQGWTLVTLSAEGEGQGEFQPLKE